MSWINDTLLTQQPRPSIDWSFSRYTDQSEIPSSNKNHIQTMGAEGRSFDISGVLLNSEDKDKLREEVNNPTEVTIDIPEIDTKITAVPTSYSISESAGSPDTYDFSLNMEETL